MTRRDFVRPPHMRFCLIGVAVVAAALAGCNGEHRQESLAQAFSYHCNVHNSGTANTVCGKNGADGAKVSRYCYKSLADPNCFDRPDPQNKNQLGSSGY